MKYKFLLLGMCVITFIQSLLLGLNQTANLSTMYPELSGLLQLAPPISTIPDDRFHVPRLTSEVIEIASITDYTCSSFAFHFAYPLHLAALLANQQELTTTDYLACELLSRLYQLCYFDSFSTSAKQTCKTALLSKRCMRDYHLIDDYQRLIQTHATPEAIIDLIADDLITRYRENRRVIDALDRAKQKALKAYDLARPTHSIMTCGGDHRLLLDKITGLNNYYTSPRPDNNTILRSSSTASFLTQESFLTAEKKRIELLLAGIADKLKLIAEQSYETLRESIKKILNVPSSTHVILTPCGTSSEMIMSLLGLASNEKWSEHYALQEKTSTPLLINIMTASEEVGSKSSQAAGLFHVSKHTPSGINVDSDQPFKEIPSNSLKTFLLNARNKKTGGLTEQNKLHHDIDHIIESAFSQNEPAVILHFVHASKTGITMPSQSFVENSKKHHKKNVLIMVDAAQMRCQPESIAQYLEKDWCVMITGSKLLAGAPFSGALLIPPSQSTPLLRDDLFVPHDFSYYFNASECDPGFPHLKKQLPNNYNYGLLLRWETALHNMKKFYSIPAELRDTIFKQWLTKIKAIIKNIPCIQLLESDIQTYQGDFIGNQNTLVSITLTPPGQPAPLKTKELKIIHKLLSLDTTPLIQRTLNHDETVIAQTKVLIGQPVMLSSTDEHELAIVRLSLSAPIVSAIAGNATTYDSTVQRRLDDEIQKDVILLKKLELLMHSYQDLAKT